MKYLICPMIFLSIILTVLKFEGKFNLSWTIITLPIWIIPLLYILYTIINKLSCHFSDRFEDLSVTFDKKIYIFSSKDISFSFECSSIQEAEKIIAKRLKLTEITILGNDVYNLNKMLVHGMEYNQYGINKQDMVKDIYKEKIIGIIERKK